MKKQDLMSRIKTQLKALIQPMKFMEIKSGDLILTTPGETLEVGAEIYYVDSDGNNAPLNEGEYTLENGIRIEVMGGKITEIAQAEDEVGTEAPMEASAIVEEEMASETEMESQSGIDMVDYGDMKTRLARCEEMIMELMKDKKMMETKMAELSALPSESGIQSKPTENRSLSSKKESVSFEDVISIRERARKNR